jgi:hypothetical protein
MTKQKPRKRATKSRTSRKRAAPTTIDTPELLKHVAEIQRLGKQTIANIILIGEHLTECRKIVGRGDWLTWPKRELGLSRQTADNFMNAYKTFGRGNRPNFGRLPMSAVYLLAGPGTPKEVRDAIIERVSKGERISLGEVAEAIRGVNVTTERKRYTSVAYVPQPETTTIPLLPPNYKFEPRTVEPTTGGAMLAAEATEFLKDYIALHLRGRGISEFAVVVEGMSDDERRELDDALGIASDLISMLKQALDVANAAKRPRPRLVSDNDGGSVH